MACDKLRTHPHPHPFTHTHTHTHRDTASSDTSLWCASSSTCIYARACVSMCVRVHMHIRVCVCVRVCACVPGCVRVLCACYICWRGCNAPTLAPYINAPPPAPPPPPPPPPPPGAPPGGGGGGGGLSTQTERESKGEGDVSVKMPTHIVGLKLHRIAPGLGIVGREDNDMDGRGMSAQSSAF